MPLRATVTLYASTGDFGPAQRVLTLDADCISVPIGRASKTLSKGLLGARDNAWFDSPVMSRAHAELLLDLDTDTLSIKDVGSMHGTYVNGNRVTANYPAQLHDGDEIVFGAEVRRGTEVFPACAFRINYEFGIFRPTNTYSFPDASDVDEAGEDFDFSDDDFGSPGASSDAESLIVHPEPKVSQSHFAIDLTRDESPAGPSIPSIDLTGDAPAGPRPAGIAPVRALDSDVILDQIAVETEVDEVGRHVESDVECDSQSSHYSSDNDSDTQSQHIGDEEEIGRKSVTGHSREDGEENGKDSAGGENGEREQDSDDMDSNFCDYDSDMATASRSLISEDSKFWENSSFAAPSSPTVIKGAERMVIADDVYKEFESPMAADEATRVETDRVLLPTISGPSIYSPYSRGPYQFASLASGFALGILSSPPVPGSFSNIPEFDPPPRTGRAVVFNRQPSPSDAAMAKGPEFKQSDIPVSYIRSTAILGDGSGKEDFFQAREHNKAKLQEASQNQDEISGTGSSTSIYERHEEIQAAPAMPTRVIKACVAKRMNLVRASDGLEGRIDTEGTPKGHIPEIPLAVSSEAPLSFDKVPVTDTSADFSARSAIQPPAEPQAVRSGLRIDEIIDGDSINQHAASPKKRKADEISKGVRVWGSALKPLGASVNAEPAPALQLRAPSSSEISRLPDSQPRKKLRKLMENVAYAALGGVAVGAALFGSLVATAPDFM